MARTDTDQLFSGELSVIFFPSGALGSLLEAQARNLNTYPLKRDRSAEVRSLGKVLERLKLVGENQGVIGISWGANSLGEAGVFIVLKSIQVRAAGPQVGSGG